MNGYRNNLHVIVSIVVIFSFVMMTPRTEVFAGQKAKVFAKKKWNDTKIFVTKGKRYQIVAKDNWIDWKTKTSAKGYASPNMVLKKTERFRRMPNAKWFSLICAINRIPKTQFDVGRILRKGRGIFRSKYTGLLTCYANDLSTMYWNNKGEIEIEVSEKK